MKNSFKYLILLSTTLGLTGCSDDQLRQGVDKFNKSVQSSSASIKTAYLSVNDQMRHRYFIELRMSPGTKAEEIDTAMVKHYSDDYIQARLLAFNALSSYTEGLAALASSTAPADAEAAIKTTGEKVSGLLTQIQGLGKSNKALQVAQLSTPISQLVGLLANQLLEMAKDNYLRVDLKESNTSVDQLCQALEDDLNEMTKIASLPESEKLLALYRVQYNGDAKLLNGSITDSTRTDFLQDYEAAATDAANISSANPAPLVEKIRTVHKKLIAYLETREAAKHSRFGKHDKPSEKELQLATSLSSDLDDFDGQAKSLAESIKKLNHVR